MIFYEKMSEESSYDCETSQECACETIDGLKSDIAKLQMRVCNLEYKNERFADTVGIITTGAALSFITIGLVFMVKGIVVSCAK